MFTKILNNKDLFSIVTSYCDENNIEVGLSQFLYDNSDDRLLILKPDNYYSTKNMPKPLPSIDCIILVKCDKTECYDIHLIELKNIKSPNGFDKKQIVSKFKTVIEHFLQDEFKNIFMNENYCNFNCYFVSNPYGCNNMTQSEYDKKIHDEGLKLEYFNLIKPFRFMNKVSFIKPKLPNPMIAEC